MDTGDQNVFYKCAVPVVTEDNTERIFLVFTKPWLLSLKRAKSWLDVSNKVLQMSSNHSLRGPPQSRAVGRLAEPDQIITER